VINTDKARSYGAALIKFKAEGLCPADMVHQQIKYLNNSVEYDHGKLKRMVKPTLGLKSIKTAYATIKGF
jgi:IS6 family transposase